MIFSLISILSALEVPKAIYNQDFVSKVTDACVMFQTHHEKTYIDLNVGKKKDSFYVDFFASQPYVKFDVLQTKFPDLCERGSCPKKEKLVKFWSKLNNKSDFNASFESKKNYLNWAGFLQGDPQLAEDLSSNKYKIEESFSFLVRDLSKEDKESFFPGYDFSDIKEDEKIMSLSFQRVKDLYYCDYEIDEDIKVRYGNEISSTFLQSIDPIYDKKIFKNSWENYFSVSEFYIPYNVLKGVVIQDFKIYLRKIPSKENLKNLSHETNYRTINGTRWICTAKGRPLKRA